MPRTRKPRRSPTAARPSDTESSAPRAATPQPPTPTATLPPKPIPPRKPQAEPDAGYVAVGRVLGPFGLQGEMRVQSLTDNADRFAARSKLFAGKVPVSISSSREAQGFVYLKFLGYPDRDSIDTFRHAMLQIPEASLAPLPEGEYYRFQLIGLEVVDREGAVLGTLDEIIETGANDVYRIRTPEGTDILLPALDDAIISIDLAARRLTADPPAWR